MALETPTAAQARLGAAGFRADLVADGIGLRDLGTDTRYEPAELRVSEVVRFEGDSDPGDEAILVAVATRDGEPLGLFTCPFGPAASADEAEILRHLHRHVFDTAADEAHDDHDHVAAVFATRNAAEAAVSELREIGLGSDHLGVAIGQGERAVFEYDEDAELGSSLTTDAVGGAVLGFLGGMLLFGAVGGLAAGGVAAIGGALTGGYAAIFAETERYASHEELRHTPVGPGEVLVVVCAHHHPKEVRTIFDRHGGRIVDTAPNGQS